jgi:glycine cleavage system protein P-like pyridoxal-binding family
MVEVPETESLADLDQLVEAMLGVYREAQTSPELVKDAPHYASVRRIDDVKASHPKTLTLHWDNPLVPKNREVSIEGMSSQESKSGLTSPPSR